MMVPIVPALNCIVDLWSPTKVYCKKWYCVYEFWLYIFILALCQWTVLISRYTTQYIAIDVSLWLCLGSFPYWNLDWCLVLSGRCGNLTNMSKEWSLNNSVIWVCSFKCNMPNFIGSLAADQRRMYVADWCIYILGLVLLLWSTFLCISIFLSFLTILLKVSST